LVLIYGERLEKSTRPPTKIPAMPPMMSPRLLSVGVPLTALVTEEDIELAEFNP